ncbi:MAG: hypothetical protein ACFFCO_07665 [Promethearchaeota archaeon]
MSVHLHTTISQKANELLEQLTKTYGTKNRVIEKALETMIRVEKVGSCDNCIIKAQAEEQNKLRDVLDLTSIRREILDELLKVALGDQTTADFLHGQRLEAQNIVELIRSSIHWKFPSNFSEFRIMIEQLGEMTRLYDITSFRELDDTIALRPRIFTRLPALTAYILVLILEGVNVPFEVRLVRNDIILKMSRKDIHALRKTDNLQMLLQRMENQIQDLKPHLFRENLVLVGPVFLKWVEKNLEGSIADLSGVLEDIRTFLRPREMSSSPRKFLEELLLAGRKMNWLSQVKIAHEEDEDVQITFQAITPSLAKISTVVFALVLATKGWKLLEHSIEYDNAVIELRFVGEGEQDVLDQLAETNLFRVVTEQFLDAVCIPRAVFNSFAAKIYESDLSKFEEIYRNMGIQIANALLILSKGDEEKIERFARIFILKNLQQAHPNAEIRFIDKRNFSIVFHQMDLIVLDSQRVLIDSMLRTLGYDVSMTTFQNLLSVKIEKLEGPQLSQLPRAAVVQMVIDAMAANSLEEALKQVKPTLDKLYPRDYPWTIRELGNRLLDMYRELGIEVDIEYFEGGFTLKYRTCPYFKLVKNNQKIWLCEFRKCAIEYILSRVSPSGKSKIKIIKSLIKNGGHPCEYAIFLTEFLANTQPRIAASHSKV